jgi:hypothetical protein
MYADINSESVHKQHFIIHVGGVTTIKQQIGNNNQYERPALGCKWYTEKYSE